MKMIVCGKSMHGIMDMNMHIKCILHTAIVLEKKNICILLKTVTGHIISW